MSAWDALKIKKRKAALTATELLAKFRAGTPTIKDLNAAVRLLKATGTVCKKDEGDGRTIH